jgi:hypothetical protein
MMAKNAMRWYDWLAIVLLVIGGLNWGMVGLFRFDLVAYLFGNVSIIGRIIYTLVGASGLYTLVWAIRQALK